MKSIALIGFVLLYVFAVSASSYTVAQASLGSSSSDSGYFKDQTTHLFSHTTQSIESVFNFTSSNFSEPKKLAKTFAAVVQVTDTLLESKFVQYASISAYFPLKFTKQDIIYPFHSFL